MTNTTEEYWDVDGTSLHTYAWNIETLGGRLNVPELRGSNILVPYNPGEVWRPKTPASRVLSLAMWVRDATEHGAEPTVAAEHRPLFNKNWDTLLRLFYVRNRLLTLTRRQEFADGYLTTVAHAELAGDMAITMEGRFTGKFVVDLRLLDPFFYGPFIDTSIAAGAGPVTINNPGHDGVVQMHIRFNGPLENPLLLNSSTAPDVSVQYLGILALGEFVDLDIGLFSALNQGGDNIVDKITHDGSRRWMELILGDNSLELTTESGDGTVDLSFQPPYL